MNVQALRRRLATSVLVVLASTTVPGGAWAHSHETTRTPPYDFGCTLADRNICIPSEEGRRGILRGGRVPAVVPTYSIPPYPVLAYQDFSLAAGINVDITERSSVRVSAIVRKTDLAELPSVEACFGVVTYGASLVPGSSYSASTNWGCTPLSGSDPIPLTLDPLTYSKTGLQPGRVGFFVYLQGVGRSLVGGPSEVRVERISYEVTPVRVLTVSVSGVGSGVVASPDEKINSCSRGSSAWRCSAAYPPRTEVVLTASPWEGSSFAGWKDCDQPDGNLCTHVIGTSDETVTAMFEASG